MVDSSGNTAPEQAAVSATLAGNAAAIAALLQLEQEAMAEVSGPLRALLRNVFRVVSGRYVIMFGSLESPASDPVLAAQLSDLLVTELENVRSYDPTGPLTDVAIRAAAQGTAYANRYLSDPVTPAEIQIDVPDAVTLVPVASPLIPVEPPADVDVPTPPPPTVVAVDNDVLSSTADAATAVSDDIAAAQEFARTTPLAEWSDVVRQVGKANQAATNLERRTTWEISKSNAAAVRRVASARGANLLWVAEPDACVVCLALSGQVIDPLSGGGFDEEATFGKPFSAPAVYPPGEPLMGPPRHPNCRCHPELWFGTSAEPDGPEENALYNRPGVGSRVDLPAALRREAKRSIVRGWSVPSESEGVRLDAADRLLRRGSGLPKSVEERGRAAVKAGKFDSRTHPSRLFTAHRPK